MSGFRRSVNVRLHANAAPIAAGYRILSSASWHDNEEIRTEVIQTAGVRSSALIAAVGFPHVDIAMPDQKSVVAAFTMEEIDRRFGDAPENLEAKVQAKAVFSERRAAWDALDERMGYSRAKQAEEDAFVMWGERLNDLFSKPAHSVAGAAAKLHAVLAMGEGSPNDEFLWPQIRAVMTDLLSLGSGPSAI
nr:hypothetical protein [Rhizobium sp. CG5]